jgi:hypothetical protein
MYCLNLHVESRAIDHDFTKYVATYNINYYCAHLDTSYFHKFYLPHRSEQFDARPKNYTIVLVLLVLFLDIRAYLS